MLVTTWLAGGQAAAYQPGLDLAAYRRRGHRRWSPRSSAAAPAASTRLAARVLSRRLADPDIAAVLTQHPERQRRGAGAAAVRGPRLPAQPAQLGHQPGRRCIRISLLAQIDALWWGREPAYPTDADVLGARDLLDLDALQQGGLLLFRYRHQAGSFVGRAARSVERRALPGRAPDDRRPVAGPGPAARPSRCSTRSPRSSPSSRRRHAAAVGDQPGPQRRAPAAAARPRLRRAAAQLALRRLRGRRRDGLVPPVRRARARCRRCCWTGSAAGDVNVIDEGQAWHVCLRPGVSYGSRLVPARPGRAADRDVRHRADPGPGGADAERCSASMLAALAPRGERRETRRAARAAGRHPAAAHRGPGPRRAALASADGRWLLCYNGELFNYRDLRAELAALGQPLRGEGDTELVLARPSPSGASRRSRRFRGEFAFAIADAARPAASTWPATRSGSSRCTGPRRDGRLHVASEIKALVPAGRAGRRGAARPPRLGRRRRPGRSSGAVRGPGGARRDGRAGRGPGRGGQAGPGRVRGQRPGPGRHRPDRRRDPVRRPGQLADPAARRGRCTRTASRSPIGAPGSEDLQLRPAAVRRPVACRTRSSSWRRARSGWPTSARRSPMSELTEYGDIINAVVVGPAVPPGPRGRGQGRAHRRRLRRAVRRLRDVRPDQARSRPGGCSCTRSATWTGPSCSASTGPAWATASRPGCRSWTWRWSSWPCGCPWT